MKQVRRDVGTLEATMNRQGMQTTEGGPRRQQLKLMDIPVVGYMGHRSTHKPPIVGVQETPQAPADFTATGSGWVKQDVGGNSQYGKLSQGFKGLFEKVQRKGIIERKKILRSQ